MDAGRQRERGLQRSMSGGSEAGLRGSFRANRASEARLARCGKNTWSGSRQPRERPALGADTFRNPASAAATPPPPPRHGSRATSASPGPRRRAPVSPGPRRKTSAILADLMRDASVDLEDDDKVLQKMEQLVQQYRPYLTQRRLEVESTPTSSPAARVTPRKESGGKSRIPAPTFFQARASPTETCL